MIYLKVRLMADFFENQIVFCFGTCIPGRPIKLSSYNVMFSILVKETISCYGPEDSCQENIW